MQMFWPKTKYGMGRSIYVARTPIIPVSSMPAMVSCVLQGGHTGRGVSDNAEARTDMVTCKVSNVFLVHQGLHCFLVAMPTWHA